MKLVIHPAVSEERLARIREAAAPMVVVQARDEAEAVAAIADADAVFGYLTPAMLKSARKLRWAQSPTASMEKYLYPELAASPVIVTNMRGIFSDVIADHVFGFILCFAKNFHTYIRQQERCVWHVLRPRTERNCRATADQGRFIRPTARPSRSPTARLASWAWAASARRPPAAAWRSVCAFSALIPWQRRRRPA